MVASLDLKLQTPRNNNTLLLSFLLFIGLLECYGCCRVSVLLRICLTAARQVPSAEPARGRHQSCYCSEFDQAALQSWSKGGAVQDLSW